MSSPNPTPAPQPPAQPAQEQPSDVPSSSQPAQGETNGQEDGAMPTGPPPDHMASMPTEYTPAFLVRAYDEFLTYITSYLGDHIFNVLQMMRTDAEAYAKNNKASPEHILAQLLAEIKDWRHLPVEKGDTTTVLDQEVDAVKHAVPNLMNAVEDALRTGAMVLSGARGTTAEAITVKVPPVRDFVNDVYLRIAKQYAGRDGTERLMRHLTKNKDKLLAEVKHASTTVLFPRESVWGMPEEKEKTITVPPGGGVAPGDAPQPPSRKTIPLAGESAPTTNDQQPEPEPKPEGPIEEADLSDDEGSVSEADSGGSGF